MKLELEDLTKDELVRLIRKLPVFGPTQRDMLLVRWDSLSQRSLAALDESINAGGTGDWKRADKLYHEAERLSKRADAVYAEIK